MDRGQRKRLADICEKLGVALFAGAAIKGILTDALVWESVLIGSETARSIKPIILLSTEA